jgi:hypothetical protein
MLIVLLLAPIRSASAAKSVLQASATTDTDERGQFESATFKSDFLAQTRDF